MKTVIGSWNSFLQLKKMDQKRDGREKTPFCKTLRKLRSFNWFCKAGSTMALKKKGRWILKDTKTTHGELRSNSRHAIRPHVGPRTRCLLKLIFHVYYRSIATHVQKTDFYTSITSGLRSANRFGSIWRGKLDTQ